MELLSPAGTLECGMAAFHYGADAVYLGMKDFSARADAGNFTIDELAVLLGVAHNSQERRRKVYVAINTLLREEELPQLVELLAQMRDMGVDALIVQDAGVIRICREFFPGFELHASTQMAVHNVEGAYAAREMGISRVVAARELSVQELGAIAAVPGLEVEAFIHGALCYSYSGLCLMSACLNGASGNRGSCTYVCRNKFRITDESGKELGNCCPLSMKDLALGEMLPAFKKANVASLKIEGRKKTPLYVAAVTNYYRKLLDGDFRGGEEVQSELDVKTIFSRPWTRLFSQNLRAAGVTDPNIVGPRGIDVGIVRKVRTTPNGDFLRFTLRTRSIEKHDGLQVEHPSSEKPYGFGIDELRVFTQGGSDRFENVFTAAPGDNVEVPLPPGHPEMPAGCKIYCTSSQDVKRRYDWPEARPNLLKARIPLSFKVTVTEENISSEVFSTANMSEWKPMHISLDAEGGYFSPAQKPENVEGDIRKAFERLGDTPFVLGKIEISNPGAFYVPKSILNELRRQSAAAALAAMETEKASTVERVNGEIAAWTAGTEEDNEAWSIKIDRPFFLNLIPKSDLNALEELVFALDRCADGELSQTLASLVEIVGTRERIRLSIPVVSRNAGFRDWSKSVATLVSQGWRKWEVGNIGAFTMLQHAVEDIKALDITADWSLYAMNRMAAKQWLDIGCRRVTTCPEDTIDNICELAKVLGNQITAVVYQDTVVARSAVCTMSSLNGFCPGKANCTYRTLTLTNKKEETLLAVNDNCMTVILNATPLDYSYALNQLRAAGISHFRMDFLWKDYAPTQVAEIWQQKR